MKKMTAILLLLCLLAGICGPAAAEDNRKVLDFPESGFTFTVPDFVENLTGAIFSISDLGETDFGSGFIYGFALYIPRTDEETAAMNDLLGSFPSLDEVSEEAMQAYLEYMAPRTELFLVVGLAEGKTWEKDMLQQDGADSLREPVKLGESGGFTYYLTAIKPEVIRNRTGMVSQEMQEAFIDAVDQIMEHPELFTLKERDLSKQAPEPGSQVDFEAEGSFRRCDPCGSDRRQQGYDHHVLADLLPAMQGGDAGTGPPCPGIRRQRPERGRLRM